MLVKIDAETESKVGNDRTIGFRQLLRPSESEPPYIASPRRLKFRKTPFAYPKQTSDNEAPGTVEHNVDFAEPKYTSLNEKWHEDLPITYSGNQAKQDIHNLANSIMQQIKGKRRPVLRRGTLYIIK